MTSRMNRTSKARKPKVLAVDDVSVVLNAINVALGKDYEVYTLNKAEHVGMFLIRTTPDLFILDIEMPGMSGYELVKVIRDSDKHKNTPIIFLTGNATVMNLQAAMELGVADFIAKPVDPEELLKRVKEKIKNYKILYGDINTGGTP
ncbi:MAG: response regulator [Oscillospiraceae bacterium]|nr:response regulator [Oscillospiraceae bacterium]